MGTCYKNLQNLIKEVKFHPREIMCANHVEQSDWYFIGFHFSPLHRRKPPGWSRISYLHDRSRFSDLSEVRKARPTVSFR